MEPRFMLLSIHSDLLIDIFKALGEANTVEGNEATNKYFTYLKLKNNLPKDVKVIGVMLLPFSFTDIHSSQEINNTIVFKLWSSEWKVLKEGDKIPFFFPEMYKQTCRIVGVDGHASSSEGEKLG